MSFSAIKSGLLVCISGNGGICNAFSAQIEYLKQEGKYLELWTCSSIYVLATDVTDE